MRTFGLALVVAMLGCSAPSAEAPTSSEHVVVGHVRFRHRTVDLTVESVDARGGDPDLRRATAQRDEEIWAGTDERYFDREGDR